MATTADKVSLIDVVFHLSSVNVISHLAADNAARFPRLKMSRPKWRVSWWFLSLVALNLDIYPCSIETQKNKATSYHLGQLKAKLAKLRRELLTPSSSGGGGGCKHMNSLDIRVAFWYSIAGFDVARTGVASVGFIGFPSVGKSTLMSRLTGQHSEGWAFRSARDSIEADAW